MPCALAVALQNVSRMHSICIAVVDAAHARLFTLERSTDEYGIHEAMIERTDLVNPSRHHHDHHPAHRERHLDGVDLAFARSVNAAIRELIDEHHITQAIVCAAPRMLGKLRSTNPGLIPSETELRELSLNLVDMTPHQLRISLAAHALLPAAPERPVHPTAA